MHAGVLTLIGPPSQEAGATAFADIFYLPVHIDSPPTPAIAWSEDGQGLQGFIRAIRVRQLNRGGEQRLENGYSLGRWARQRSNRLADRCSFAARRRAGEQASRPPGSFPGATPGLSGGDMTRATPQVPRDAGHGGDEGRVRADRARSIDKGRPLVD